MELLRIMNHYNLANKSMTGHGTILSLQNKFYKTWYMNKVLRIIHRESQCKARSRTSSKCTKNINSTDTEQSKLCSLIHNFLKFYYFLLYLKKVRMLDNKNTPKIRMRWKYKFNIKNIYDLPCKIRLTNNN